MANPASESPRTDEDRRGSVALDQWRGLALVFVLIAHAFHESSRMDGVGRVGVNVFFFISGILVFRSLARSGNSGAWPQAKSFWWRRLRRLYPALVMYVLVMGIAEYWLQRLPGSDRFSTFANFLDHVPAALGYVINYALIPAPSLGHLWSLSCEMQFYFLAPFIFFGGGENPFRRNLLFGLILLMLLVSGAAQPFLPAPWAPWSLSKYGFQAAVWPMMLGFWCEGKRGWLHRLPPGWRLFIYRLTLACCVGGLAVMLFGRTGKVAAVILGTPLLLPCLLAYDGGRTIAPWLGGGVVRWLGHRTYSIYLWQQAFTICHFLPVRLWPVGALLAVALGALWFHLFEAPFLSSGRKPAAGS